MVRSIQIAILFGCIVAIANAATVYETAKAAGLTTLVAAIDAAGYENILNNPHFEGTVFAPTNEAFAALLKKLKTTPEKLLSNKKLLQAVLQYHVIPDDALTTSDLDELQSEKTLLKNAHVTLYKSPYTGKARVYFGNQKVTKTGLNYDGSADVIKPNVKADQAIVQVINAVLVPPMK